ncbi:MAG: hypothetical protein IJ093_00130 [Bacilli bacterium]|nr:hypothetical protein [Bacilli bacterium]
MNKFKYTKTAMSILLAGTLALPIVGCSSKKQEENYQQPSMEQIQETQKQPEEIQTEDPSTAVESAITIMIDGAERLSEASEEAKQTESYQNEKEEVLRNFDVLFGFLFNHKEIDGYTIDDVSESTKERAKEALFELDKYIEVYIPDYKEKAKEKLQDAKEFLEDKGSDAFAWLSDEYDNLKEKTLEKKKK